MRGLRTAIRRRREDPNCPGCGTQVKTDAVVVEADGQARRWHAHCLEASRPRRGGRPMRTTSR